MPLTQGILRTKLNTLALLGAIAALMDTLWGVLAVLGLDLSRGNELLMGITFVLGLPMSLLDLDSTKRIAFGLVTLFWLRWVACCFGGATAVLCSRGRLTR